MFEEMKRKGGFVAPFHELKGDESL